MVGITLEVMRVGLVQWGDGMDHIIASFIRARGGVMFAATWWRPPPSPPPSLTEDLPFMAEIFISLHPKTRSTGGLSVCVKTLPATLSMWGAQLLCAKDGHRPRKPAWMPTAITPACISIL